MSWLMGATETSVKIGLRKGWFRSIAVGLGGAAVSVLLMGGYRILNSRPEEAFALLRAWGPAPIIEILIVMVVGTLLQQIVDISRAGVGAQERMAEAMAQIAAKDDRQLQEIQTLAAYTAQQSDKMHRRHIEMQGVLSQIAARMKIPTEGMD